MIISCLGDSLTRGDYGVFGKSGIANISDKNYPYFLAQSTGAKVNNYGVCGVNPTHFYNYYKKENVDIKNSDIVIIMLGTNGGLHPTEKTQANEDYKALIDLCLKDAPNASLFICTPPHTTENPEFSNCGFAQNVTNATLFIREFAKQNNLNLIDVFDCGLFTAENEHIMQTNDGLHFVEEGYKTLANFIEKELRKYGKIR